MGTPVFLKAIENIKSSTELREDAISRIKKAVKEMGTLAIEIPD